MKTTFTFSLPHGYVDSGGEIHQEGFMRLARAMDEISAVQDPRVRANEAYLPVLIFSKVITRRQCIQSHPYDIVGIFWIFCPKFRRRLPGLHQSGMKRRAFFRNGV